ncbi:uncharacterized protein LOC143275567 [Babylonia areolata]|uniref:uncharacterized protein LOC143275567 n=1 Tax=Babylonia areolata TaxID=304850 RepID=UPI003FCF93CC
MYGQLETYKPPEWAATLSYIPKKRIQLAMTNTPIHPWKLPGVPEDFSVSVKRDDLTGCALSGNKIRKLEFLLADAVDQGCRHVITCGEFLSNHCRAVAVSARQLGLTPHLFLRTDITDVKRAGCEGNMLLNRLCEAHVYLVPPHHDYDTDVMDSMQRLVRNIRASSGESCYVIPMGGASKTGLFGYIHAFEELRQQGVLEQFDDLVFPCGSGGTSAELAIANHLTGGHLRLHGVAAAHSVDFFYEHCDKSLKEVGLGHLKSRDLLRVVGGFIGRGYGLSTKQELEFIQHVAAQTSVMLDIVYSAKAVLGLVSELRNNPSAFQGRRILYLHTGGIFSLYDERMTPVLEDREEQQHHIKLLSQMDETPV